ncbi:hypothetical protein [uncultured Methylophaga sp.]|uniref:hypothetical protein n=1 Tax=uncultured Methylophaga sp. TaxID=285271 RepID=UPI002602CAD8|nr:hypothetical protein [uncultured Methylophaga sp.]
MTSHLQKADENQRLPCNINGCPSYRRGVSRFCSSHTKRQSRHGDPTGHPIKRTDNREAFNQAEHFLSCNWKHPAVTLLEESIEMWLMKAGEGYDVPGNKLVANLFVQQVKPRQVLSNVLAISLIRDNGRYPQLGSPRGLEMAIGNTVLSLAPRRRKANGRYDSPTPSLIREIGAHLSELLGDFTAKAIITFKQEEERQRQLARSVRCESFKIYKEE